MVVLKPSSWLPAQGLFLEGSEDHMPYWGLSLDQLLARQAPSPVHYFSSPNREAKFLKSKLQFDGIYSKLQNIYLM